VYGYDYACVEVLDQKNVVARTDVVTLDKSSTLISANFLLPKLTVGKEYTLNLYGLPSNGAGCFDSPSQGIIREQFAHGTYIVPQRPGPVPLIFEMTGWRWNSYIKNDNSLSIDMGASVALSSDTMVVGIPGCMNPGDTDPNGLVLVYTRARNREEWGNPVELRPTPAGKFGDSVALNEDRNILVIGAPHTTGSGGEVNAGAIWIYEKDGSGNWNSGVRINPPSPATGALFGNSVSVSGTTVVVGELSRNIISARATLRDAGAAYVIEPDLVTRSWGQPTALNPYPALAAGDRFGSSVTIVGGRIAVGAFSQSYTEQTVTMNPQNSGKSFTGGHTGVGGAYVFEKNGSGGWDVEAYLNVPHFNQDQSFGCSLSFDPTSNDRLVIGACLEQNPFSEITPVPVATSGTPQANPNLSEGRGAAYVFEYDDSLSAWKTTAYLKAPNSGGSGRFGFSVSIYDGVVAVGAPQEKSTTTVISNGKMPTNIPDSSNKLIGAVYIFKQVEGVWQRSAFLKPPFDGSQSDMRFGRSVALYQNSLVIGALSDKSNVTGVKNGDLFWKDPSFSAVNEDVSNSGAAYVFENVTN
jgi:hypothetical protein